MVSYNMPSIEQTSEAMELSFFSMDICFFSRLSLICGAWAVRVRVSTWMGGLISNR